MVKKHKEVYVLMSTYFSCLKSVSSVSSTFIFEFIYSLLYISITSYFSFQSETHKQLMKIKKYVLFIIFKTTGVFCLLSEI